MLALVAPSRRTLNTSSGSSSWSALVCTTTVSSVWPGAKVSVPLTGS